MLCCPTQTRFYDQDDVINSLWQQFTDALTRAKRVFVLGHSLNDAYLLRALAATLHPFDRIAVTVLENERNDGKPHKSAASTLEKITAHLGNAAIIPIRFGDSPDTGHNAIRVWRDKLAADGLLDIGLKAVPGL